MKKKRWKIPDQTVGYSQEIVDYYGLSPITGRILARRGILTLEDARLFFEGGLEALQSPFLLPGLEKAVERTAAALRNEEKILIYGDYDVDGLTSVALLLRVLRPFNKGNIIFYIPKRLDEGYGLHEQALAKAARYGCSLVVTVDCGITACREADFLAENRIDLVITDHHEIGEQLPKALAIVNPKLAPSVSGDARTGYVSPAFSQLAGVGVAFKFLQGLARELPELEEKLRSNLDLVALGTIADLVPLLGENRILVKEGLKVLTTTKNPGLAALIRSAGLGGKEVNAWDVGFLLAPRLNACGRLGDSTTALRLLTATDRVKAEKIANRLELLNQQRKKVEEEVFSEAVNMLERNAQEQKKEKIILLAGEGWHPGVIGIVASRLVEKYYKPTVLLSMNEEVGRGSARSIEGFHIFKALARCSAYLERFGGHEMAAGLEVHRDKLEDFHHALQEVAETHISTEMLIPQLEVEDEVDLQTVNACLLRELQSLAPFGVGNRRPVLVCRGVRLVSSRVVGKDGKHLRIMVGDGTSEIEGIGFNFGSLYDRVSSSNRLDLAFCLDINEWNNQLQLVLKDLSSAG
ncbi:MAG TPA: single-stranded-DNA-specific exonuclease RecJ [Firmicutes bacterium]|nr:single-stranded-DNA-specific exonuclease RecJ [Bacillota bacterium]